VVVAAVAGVSLPVAAQQRGGPEEVVDLLTRVGARIEQYFARAQSIVCDERVRIQPLGYSLGARDLGASLSTSYASPGTQLRTQVCYQRPPC
jgi:hypothetical protein